jgi:tetratricopeptide (TPR) repeat protein
MVLGLTLYVDRFIDPFNTNMLLYKKQIQLNFREIFNVIFVCLLLIYVFYKKIINRKELMFFVIWFILCLFTTFLLPDYLYLNHRVVLSIFSAVAIICYLVGKILITFPNLKKYLLIFWCISFVVLSYLSFFQQDKYKDRDTYWGKMYSDASHYHAFAYMLSRRYLEENNLQKSKELLLEAISLSDNRYLSDLALIYYREGNMDKAEELYNEAIEYGINKAQCYRNLSVIYLKRDNDINKAIDYAKLAVQQEPYDDGYKKYLKMLESKKNED